MASTATWADIKGAGATFPSAVYESWARQYEKTAAVKVSYQPTGSGDGVKRMVAREVQFGGTDVALSDAELSKHKLIQIPTLVGGLVPVVNLGNIGNNELRLTGAVLADIMLGNIGHWNDSRIAKLNPNLTLPSKPIVRVVRSDKSGSTEGFTRYLSMVSSGFASQVGSSLLPKWPKEDSVEAAQGNDGIVKAIASTPGAIGYVSYDRLLKTSLAGVRLETGDGSAFIAASEEGFRQAVRISKMQTEGMESAPLLNLPSPSAWPITLATYIVFDAAPKKASDVSDAMQFLYWTQLAGDKLVKNTGFAPLPLRVQATFSAKFLKIAPQDGNFVKLF